ncbi:DUF7507 domain-containing protein, partial [Flavobacterium foetidum]|uniref:DUF7507 domain-containing protein n=1 Tax=Flavobacterium foetidum TaxID=2026681 RepID=UPI001074DC5F
FVDANNDGKTNVGDKVTYAFTVKNTGETTLTNITVTDDNANVTGFLTELPAGAEDAATFTAVHIITQADIDKGMVYNLATATGKDPKGDDVTNTSTDPTPTCTTCPKDPVCTDCTITPVPSKSSISITKHGTFVDANNDGKTNVGDKVTYAFTVKNTGETTLTNITVTDDNANVTGFLTELPAGAEDAATFTAVHIITQADIDKGMVYNLATATGKDPKGDDVTNTSTDPTPTCTTCPIDPACPDCTITPLTSNSSIAVIKKAVFVDENNNGYAEVGETIRYSFEVKNTGNETLTNVTITDNLPGLILSGGPITLAPGEINSTNFVGVYAITKADIDAGSVTNQALAEGTTPSGEKVNALSDNTNFVDDKPTVIDVVTCVVEVFNAVSPNGDGINDEFHIQGLECYPNNTVEIYNRWGVKVFETSGYGSNGNTFKGYSDGRATISRGESLPDGTYFYILKCFDEVRHKMLDKSGYLYIKK